MSVPPAVPAGGRPAVATGAPGRPGPADRPVRVVPVPALALAASCGARWVPAARPADAPAVTSSDADAPDGVVVTGVALDSRRVEPGDLYAALPGAHAHGADFVAQAAARGAIAVLTDPAGAPAAAAAGLPALVVDDPRAVLGDVSAQVHGHPARDLLVLGVTGTNGKTTVSTLLEGALTAAGRRSGLIGTTGSRVAGTPVGSGAGSRTTPEAPDLHALLAVMRERGVEALAMEVSSHAVVMHRVDGLVLDVIGFTQLSQDHLDFHGDMESYYAAKAQLFHPRRARHGVITVDDAWGARLAREAAAAGLAVTTVSTGGGPPAPADRPAPAADWSLVPGSVRPAPGGTAFALTGPDGGVTELVSPLPGGFNVANTALALVVLVTAGTAPADAAAGLAAAAGPPGRMQVVPGPAGAPRGVVDYAHTPEAVTAALGALRPTTAGALVVVLGAGGDRDRGKRPLMGAAAAAGADLVVVTDDNPRGEDPAAVRAAVLAGALAGVGDAGGDGAGAGAGAGDRGGRVLEVGDRAAAIRRAVAAAGPDGTVLVAGKGHERGQEVAGRVLPFDDVQELAAALADVPRAGPAPAPPPPPAPTLPAPTPTTTAPVPMPPVPTPPATTPTTTAPPPAGTPTTSSTGPAMTAPPRPPAPAPGAHR